jgi:pyrimidine and pyridine-specific 5'-nucleotidase
LCPQLRIDPLAYNREVDDTLDLDAVLKPSQQLTDFLSSIDTTKVKPWILTNAYITHAKRCLKLLDIEQFFEGNNPSTVPCHGFLLSFYFGVSGVIAAVIDMTLTLGITYCDYAQENLVCKPKDEMFVKAMAEAGISDKSKCYFVDDSYGTIPFPFPCHFPRCNSVTPLIPERFCSRLVSPISSYLHVQNYLLLFLFPYR